jgi:hypothetical protein
MITNFFSKSRPTNYALVLGLVLLSFIIVQNHVPRFSYSGYFLIEKAILFLIVASTIILVDYSAKENGLSKTSSFTILFLSAYFILFYDILNNFNLLVSNLLIVLALRKIIRIQTLKLTKEKIFDASFLIFTASFFHSWAIIFILLVFFAIILNVSRDYRNWILPTIAFIAVLIMSIFLQLLIKKEITHFIFERFIFDFDFYYFKNKYQNLVVAIYSMLIALFFFSQVISYPKKPLLQHNPYKIIMFSLFIGLFIYFVSPQKSNGTLVYTFTPMAIMGMSFIDDLEVKWLKEAIVSAIIILSFLFFFMQL